MVSIRKMIINADKFARKCPYSMQAETITIHNTANDASAEAERNNVNRIDNNAEVSFHYAVDDKEAIQLIEENRNTWHAGDGGSGKGNRSSIAIEICYSKSGGERFDKAEENCAELVASILKRRGWGIDRVRKHQDWSGKYCPHRTLDKGWQMFLNMIQAKMNGSNVVQPNTPSTSGAKQYLFLKGHMTKWNIYPTNVAPITGNQCGALNPSLFGGIEYEILANPQKDVYTIETRDFGRVNIYVPKDNDSEFYTKGGSSSNTTAPTPQPSNKQYVNLSPNDKTWRVYQANSGRYSVGQEVGMLAPANYGGLSYEVLKQYSQANMYEIKTSSFGTVAIWCDDVTSSPKY